MFHNFAIMFYCTLLALAFLVSYSTTVFRALSYFEIWFLQSQFLLSAGVHLVSFLIILIVLSFLFIYTTSRATNIKVGKSPITGCSIIAYKFGLSDTVTSSAILSDRVNLPNYDKIHICYERKGSRFGIAHGAIISDQVTENIKEQLAQQGYSVFQTMSPSTAMYISCPTLPWLSYFGIWISLFIVYPRFYKYSKIHRLSAYPVVELYRRFSVVLMAPLSQQDLFLVPEAKSLLNRSCSETDSTCCSTTDLSYASLRHSRSRTVNSIHTTIIDNNNVIKPDFICTSTPILSNGSVKEGYED